MKPRLFIASSVEGLEVAYATQENLEHDFEVTVWPQSVFTLSKPPLSSLVAAAKASDAAAFVFSPDDTAVTRGTTKPAIRDNVLFELGLFIGVLGSDKCFILKPRSFPDLHLPSDLVGVTPGDYDDKRSDGNTAAALGAACHKIRLAFKVAVGSPPAASTKIISSTTIGAALLAAPHRLYFNPPRSKRMQFDEHGFIIEGNNKNEHAWRVVDNQLELIQLDGRVHSRFSFDPVAKRFTHTDDADTLSMRGQYMVLDDPK